VRLAAAANLAAAMRSERIWPAREGMYRKALARADSRHWEACLAEAALIDRLSKGRGSGDPWLQLERLIAAMAQPRSGFIGRLREG